MAIKHTALRILSPRGGGGVVNSVALLSIERAGDLLLFLFKHFIAVSILDDELDTLHAVSPHPLQPNPCNTTFTFSMLIYFMFKYLLTYAAAGTAGAHCRGYVNNQ